ncbi:methyltransferase domain-containing protein [Candidatus Poribacteria bacterium]|nr:methyltransferase domain-containing protein [Candidatus Poribacteria bacterium]
MKSVHNAVREQFSQHANYYAQSSAHAEGDTLDIILDFAEPQGTERTLDIATGTGFTAFKLAPKVASVIATDLTPAMLTKAAELAEEKSIKNISFSLAAAESLPFADASLDSVTCRIAPHHFQDVPAFLSEVHRVLCPDGRFCMVDSVVPESKELIAWQNRVEWLRDNSHVYGYPPSEWDAMIADAGLSLEKTALVRNAQMSFLWWVRPEENPPEVVQEIRDAFANLSPDEAKEHYTVHPAGDDFYFSWPMYAVKARRTGN